MILIHLEVLKDLSGNEGYESNFHGIVNLSGAVGDQEWIVENDIPIASMHGDLDDVVPYDNSLITLFGLNIAVDGSYIINQKMQELGNIAHCIHITTKDMIHIQI